MCVERNPPRLMHHIPTPRLMRPNTLNTRTKSTRPLALTALVLILAGVGCDPENSTEAPDAASTADASGGSDAAAPDASDTRDAAQDATRDAAPDAAVPTAEACESQATAQGWTFCSGDASQCAVVFEDGTGCASACARLGLECVDGFEDEPGVCDYQRDEPALGCADSGHQSDYCVCGVGDVVVDPLDAGGEPDVGMDADAPCVRDGAVTVHLVGDSTVATGSGWGDFLEARLVDATVENAAIGGRSSKSFYDEGSFDAVRDALGAGDYLFIQFGHNDSKPEAYRATDPGEPPAHAGTYREYLERYLDAARDAGATPILVTSVNRMVFGSDGSLNQTLGQYPSAARAVAADAGVTLLDLEERSREVFSALGKDETLRLYADEPDLTHFPPDKAPRVAEMVVDLLGASDSPLRCHIR